jgi:predicted ester cyclase
MTVDRQTLDSNKELVRAFLARVFVGRDAEAVDEFVSPDFNNHVTSAHGTEDMKRVARLYHDTVPDLDAEIEHLIADGDLVALHVKFIGTHGGAVELGDRTLPPSGGQLSVQHVHIFRIADARICEHWAVRDDLTLFRQLGVFQD